MAIQVVMGAMCACSFGVAPSALAVLPKNTTNAGSVPAANIMDNIPMTNVMPFGMCNTPSNPTVASATAAALGVLTPQPCIPATASPWAPGAPNVLIANFPALDNASTCTCMWGGVISVVEPGEQTTQIP